MGAQEQFPSVCLIVVLVARVLLFVTQWAVACQDPLSMEFSRQDYWSELPFPLPGDLPNPGIKAVSLKSPALASIGSLPLALPGKPPAKTKHSQRIFFLGQ